jgi:hypothetical protein
MKRQLLFPVLLLATSAVAQVPKNQSIAIVEKATATWCGPCGGWGWDLHEDIMADNAAKAFVFTLYGDASSNYYNSTADALTSWGQSWPNWGVNNKNRTAFSSSGGIYTTTTQTTIKSAVDSFYATAAKASTGFTFKIVGNTVTVETKTKFWQAGSGSYYLAAYLTEDSVYGYQNGHTGNAYHHYVLRGSMSGPAYGDLIASGTIAANQTYDKTFTFNITDATWQKPKLKVVTVLWKQNGSSYDFINANHLKDFPTGVSDIPAVQELSIYPNPASGAVKVSGYLTRSNSELNLINFNGQVVASRKLSGSFFSEKLDVSNLANGVYLLEIKNEEGARQTEKIVVNN